MLLKLLSLCFLLASASAWLAPERCQQSGQSQSNPSPSPISVETVSNVGEIAAKQHENLVEHYKNHQFLGVPIKAVDDGTFFPPQIEIHAPFNCSFNTYDPSLLSTVACSNANCKLSHTVATTDTYTASEGYNWGVKISSKLSLFEKIFEIGGEASTGGSYTCTYTKGRTTTDLVECSDTSGVNGHLQLYTVRSDMYCDFGQILLVAEERQGGTFKEIIHAEQYFSEAELRELYDSAQVRQASFIVNYMLDMDKISDSVLQKLIKHFPLYNPYTDWVSTNTQYIRVSYYKRSSNEKQYRRVVPFTNEAGNSVYQYACIKTPS